LFSTFYAFKHDFSVYFLSNNFSSMQEAAAAAAAAAAAETAKYQATIDELRGSNDALRTKLRSVCKSNQDAKQRHARDVARLSTVLRPT